MSTYTLFDKEVVISSAADRFFFVLKMFETTSDAASKEFKYFYEDCGNISTVLDKYVYAVQELTEKWAVNYLYDMIIKLEIYDVSRESFENECWDLSAAEQYYDAIADKYNAIVGDSAQAKQYRTLRKASRARYGWMATDWPSMTTAAIRAGTLNVMSAAGHSMVNAVGNAGTAIVSSMEKKSLYKNNKTLSILNEGLIECMKNTYLYFMDFVNNYMTENGNEEFYDGSCFDSEKADALFQNAKKVPEKEKELLVKAFTLCPYHYDLSAYIFINFEEERKNIFNIAKKYQNDLLPLFELIVAVKYTEEIQCSEEKSLLLRKEIVKLMNDYGISECATLDNIDYFCLKKLCDTHIDFIVDDNFDFLNSFRNHEAQNTVKAKIIEELRIWELAKEYGVEFSNEVKEEIIDKFYEKAKNSNTVDIGFIVSKIKRMIKEMNLDNEEEIVNDYEYDILAEISDKYKNKENDIEDILSQIVSCKVSDETKKEIIYDYEIWELSEQYGVEFDDKDKPFIAAEFYKELLKTNVDDDTMKSKLDEIIKILHFSDGDGYVSEDNKTILFEHLSGIVDANIEYYEKRKNIDVQGTKRISTYIVDYISNTTITFMSMALKYKRNDIEECFSKISYCTLDEDEIIYFIYDAHPIMNPLKYGFCFTNKRIIAKQESGQNFTILIDDVIGFEKKGLLSSKISLKHTAGIKELDVSELQELSKLSECFNEVVKQIQENIKKKEKEEIQLKKEYVQKRNECIKNSSFLKDYLKVNVDEESVEDTVFEETKEENEVSAYENKSVAVMEEARLLVKDGKKMEAIYMVKEFKGIGLKEAKDIVDSFDKSKKLCDNINTTKVISDIKSNDVTSKTDYIKDDTNNLNFSEISYAEQKNYIKTMLEKYNIPISIFTPGGTKEFDKKIGKAREAYAKYNNDEHALLLYDATLFGNAKEGFVLTDKNIYINMINCKNVCIPINEIKDVISKKAPVVPELYIVGPYGEYYFTRGASNKGEDKYLTFIKELFGIIKNNISYNENSNNHMLQPEYKFCTQCGNKLTLDSAFCSKCGKKQ